ncbi:unnamed protein product [Closterium sp. NIES-64]|nr:unnamed protein product [Closterium sp. NIES-64]
MAFKLGRLNLGAVAQGVGGLVFGSGDDQEDDCGVERLLDRISNGVLAEDRQSAMADLRDVVTDSPVAQQALGAMGIPVLLSVLREDREDVDLIRGALEVLVAGLAAGAGGGGAEQREREWGQQQQRVAPGVINSELFAREPHSIALLLALLVSRSIGMGELAGQHGWGGAGHHKEQGRGGGSKKGRCCLAGEHGDVLVRQQQRVAPARGDQLGALCSRAAQHRPAAGAARESLGAGKQQQRVAPGAINSELFAREPRSIAFLLALLMSGCDVGGGEGGDEGGGRGARKGGEERGRGKRSKGGGRGVREGEEEQGRGERSLGKGRGTRRKQRTHDYTPVDHPPLLRSPPFWSIISLPSSFFPFILLSP